MTHHFLWLDLETTGLEPRTGRILEFAAVLCEDGRDGDFAVTQQFTSPIHIPDDELIELPIDIAVQKMHHRNGLWREVRACDTTLASVDEFLAAVADDLTGGRKHAVQLAGNSVHFDLAWCRAHMPVFAEYLHHRVLDVTTLRSAVDIWAGVQPWPQVTVHRALPDILNSIATARMARKAWQQ